MPLTTVACIRHSLLALWLAAAGPDLLDRADVALRAEAWDEVVSLLEPVEDPTARGLELLATAYVELGRAEDALGLLAPAAERDDATAGVLIQAGRAAVAANDERALGFFERAHRLDTDHRAVRELGLLHSKRQRPDLALPFLRAWLEDHPDDSEARLGAAFAEVQAERLDAAEAVLAGDPTGAPHVVLLLANLQARRGALAEAADTVEPLLGHEDPEFQRQARAMAFELAIERGDAEGVGNLLGGASLPPAHALRLARAQQRRGDQPAALATVGPFRDRLLEVGTDPNAPGAPERVAMARGIAQLLLDAERPDEAVDLLRLATELAPDDEAIRAELERARAAAEPH